MPFNIPTIDGLRRQGRDFVTAATGVGAIIPNSPMRIVTDGNSAMASLNLQYLQWLSRQLLPDTAESEWLTRHANIWLPNGRKQATYATGQIAFTGTVGSIVPAGTQLISGDIIYATTVQITIGAAATYAAATAQTGGSAGNLLPGSVLSVSTAISGVDGTATVVSMEGGTDPESDDDLRIRVLNRIQKPPMGGDADDYVAWALSVSGVTRAWCSPGEMGIGTVTLRFMCDELRADQKGFPTQEDVDAVSAYIESVRPVSVRDVFVLGPTVLAIDITISNLSPDTAATRAAIYTSVEQMIRDRSAPAHAVNGVAQPAQTIYAVWISDAILNAPGVDSFDLTIPDQVMPGAGYMAVLGDVTYV